MPTMRQIRLDPSLRNRLAGNEEREREEEQDQASLSSFKKRRIDDYNNNNTAMTAPTAAAIVPIRTPSALLSRDPTQLLQSTTATTTTTVLSHHHHHCSMDFIKNIRAAVADAIIMDEHGVGHGGNAVQRIACVSKFCVEDGFLYSGAADGGSDGHGKTNSHAGGAFHPTLRPPPLFVGAVTALDLCAETLLLFNNNNTNSNINNNNNMSQCCCIGTGSYALDKLLEPHSSYHSSWKDGWNLPFPYKIPQQRQQQQQKQQQQRHDDHNDAAAATTTTIPQPLPTNYSQGGIPFGMVTEFSGPTASGKSQLTMNIAARASLLHDMQVHYLISGGGGGGSRKAVARRLYSLCVSLARSASVDDIALLHKQYTCQEKDLDDDGRRRVVEKELKNSATTLAAKAMERITIVCVHDAYSLLATLARIENGETNNEEATRSSTTSGATTARIGTLLVLDSASGCLGHHLSGGYSTVVGASLANQVALTLRRMARELDGRFDDGTYYAPDAAADVANNSTGISIHHQPRRFAVVVTNGSVAKRSTDNDIVTTASTASSTTNTKVSSNPIMTHKPAMGRYWQVSDIGVWLEEEQHHRHQQQQQQTLEQQRNNNDNFQKSYGIVDANGIEGLTLVAKKVVCATLQNHYGKSCYVRRNTGNNQHQHQHEKMRNVTKFLVGSNGISDA